MLIYENVLCNLTVSVLSDLALRQRAFSWPSVGSLTADSASVPTTGSTLFLSARRSMLHYIQLLPWVPWVVQPDLFQIFSPMNERITPGSWARNDSLREVKSAFASWHVRHLTEIDLKMLLKGWWWSFIFPHKPWQGIEQLDCLGTKWSCYDCLQSFWSSHL